MGNGCARLSNLLVSNWNRRDAVARELERPMLASGRRAYLCRRYHELCTEGDSLEAQMSRAARAPR